MSAPVPAIRITSRNDAAIRETGEFVLYWMTSSRRAHSNFALDHAIDRARELGKPLIVLEALRCGYQWASDRLHRFVLQGMADNAKAFADGPIHYHPYVETQDGDGRGLLRAFADRACIIIADDYPCFFLPRMTTAAAQQVSVRFETVDSNGMLPMRAPGGRVFTRAFDFRRWLQRHLPAHLAHSPETAPLVDLDLPPAKLPAAIAKPWPAASDELLRAEPAALASLPIDHSVTACTDITGGTQAGHQQLRAFVDAQLATYHDDRNHPDKDGPSGLSPWLHFGHVAAHDVFDAILAHEQTSLDRIGGQIDGARQGFWGMSESAEAFLDQLITWRELGFNMCLHQTDYDQFASLPDWARQTLDHHELDPRPQLYSPEQLDKAQTDDEIWNAAQRQLVRTGRMHNYLRMLWGKKVLQWSPTPQFALQTLIEFNNRYALDGRDPNSYSGIFWVFGRYDRAWGPERPIFGKIRYMTSNSTRRKLRLTNYLAQFGEANGSRTLF